MAFVKLKNNPPPTTFVEYHIQTGVRFEKNVLTGKIDTIPLYEKIHEE
jgi:hypothetical protein